MSTLRTSEEEEVGMDAKMSAMVKEILQSWIMLGCCKARVTTNESPFRNYNKPCSESH
jgi:hypothetical protein